MRRAIIAGLVLVAASGAAFATDYTWTATGAVTAQYDCQTVWNSGAGGFPSTSDDRLIFATGASTGKGVCTFPAGTFTLGEVRLDNGLISTAAVSYFRIVAGTQSGDFLIQNAGVYEPRVSGYLAPDTVDADGNVKIKAFQTPYAAAYLNIIMRGSGKVLAIGSYQSDRLKSVTVESGASVSYDSSLGATSAQTYDLYVKGTITGGNWLISSPTWTTIPVGVHMQGGTWTGGTVGFGIVDCASAATYLQCNLDGGTYYKIDTNVASQYGNSGSKQRRWIRMKGNITTTSDFTHNANENGYARDMIDKFDTDNGSGVSENLTVNGNFLTGGTGTGKYTTTYYGFHANSSTITVAGNTSFRAYSYVQGGTSTWNLGGNVAFQSATASASGFCFDNSDMSATTLNITKAGRPTLLLNNKLKLGSLYVNPTATGTHAHLTGDNVLLYGNFGVLGANSGFNMDCSASWLLFKGGHGTDATAQTIELDNTAVSLRKVWIKQGSPTWVKLLSDLTVADNLNIDSGCELLLNGHTLTVQGAFPGTYSGAGQWTVRGGGLVVGGAVPEPATLLLLGSGLLGGIGYVRRRRMTR